MLLYFGEHRRRRDDHGHVERRGTGVNPIMAGLIGSLGLAAGDGRKGPGGQRRRTAALLAKADNHPDRPHVGLVIVSPNNASMSLL